MPRQEKDNYSDEEELEKLRKDAENVFGIEFDEIVHSGSERNLLGIRSKNMLFSRRLDSLTYFIQDSRYEGREAEIFRGSDKVHFKRCRKILKGLNISLAEIDQEVIIKENTQVARVDYKTKEVHKEKVQEGKHIARVSRKVEDLSVWSSGIVLRLSRKRTIEYLQLHWPELPKHVVNEAHHLAYKVKHKWEVPEQLGAGVESIEAGIIHSPAMGFLMDMYPAIRVIYSPKAKQYGQKPVYYYDRHGKPIPIPRLADIPLVEQKQRTIEKRD